MSPHPDRIFRCDPTSPCGRGDGGSSGRTQHTIDGPAYLGHCEPQSFMRGGGRTGISHPTSTLMKTICFDLDGTLTDPKIGITRSIQHALTNLGREAPHADE